MEFNGKHYDYIMTRFISFGENEGLKMKVEVVTDGKANTTDIFIPANVFNPYLKEALDKIEYEPGKEESNNADVSRCEG